MSAATTLAAPKPAGQKSNRSAERAKRRGAKSDWTGGRRGSAPGPSSRLARPLATRPRTRVAQARTRGCAVAPPAARPSAATPGGLRLTDRGIAVILAAGAMILLAAVTVIALTAVTVTSADHQPLPSLHSVNS